MRLVVISNTRHYRRADGTIVGWGPTVEEIDHMCSRFDVVRHIACLHSGEPPSSFRPYASDRVQLIPLRETGGDTLREKLMLLAAAPGYAAVMLRELANADMVHLRCPANLPMIAVSMLPFLHQPRARWIKYAGNWRPEQRGSLAFAYQRWLLGTTWTRATVTVNGSWPGQPAHIKSFYNPSLSAAELDEARTVAETKRWSLPLRLLFVGRLWRAKGCDVAIDALAHIVGSGVDATLDLVGDGPERPAFEQQVERLGLSARVTFHGWQPREQLAVQYARAHFMLFPSRSEGWPKVLSEGMAYGVVPIASAVGAIPQYLEDFRTGRSPGVATPEGFADAIREYIDDPKAWSEDSHRGLDAARYFSYAHYLRALDALLEELPDVQSSRMHRCSV